MTDPTGTDRRNGPHPLVDESLGPGLKTGNTGEDLIPGHARGRGRYLRAGRSGNAEDRDPFLVLAAALRTTNGIGNEGERGRRSTGGGAGVETGRSGREIRRKTKRSACVVCVVYTRLTPTLKQKKKIGAVTSQYGRYGIINENEFSISSFRSTCDPFDRDLPQYIR